MREVRQRLGDVAHRLARRNVVLLAEEAEVVARPQRTLEALARLVEASLRGEALHEPERAGQEAPLASRLPVVGLVAAHEAVLVERGGDRVGGAHHPLVASVEESDRAEAQQRGVERKTAEAL